MSGMFLLDWAIVAVSLFNTVLLLWLGLTVLLNAEHRTWGIWLAGGGLLLGAAFFVSHSAILGYGLDYQGPGIDFWWHVGWVPVIVLPFVWYVLMLWYSGYWESPQEPTCRSKPAEGRSPGRLARPRQVGLRRRQRPWLFLAWLLAAGLAGLFVVANPLPSYSQVASLELAATPSIAGIPAVILLYPLYILLCIALSLDALARPEPSARVPTWRGSALRQVGGDLARRRARPWLVAASLVLLAVSLLVAGVMAWIVANARAWSEVYTGLSQAVAWADLLIASLIALSVVLTGQAIVAYEVFAGKTLPRRGLQRQWRRAVILAAGYGLAVGWSLVLPLRPIYGLLLATGLMTLFFALLSWRSFEERERTIEHLRPFVASPRLYEHLLAAAPAAALDRDVQALFRALCDGVLGARLAYLVPLGPLAALVGTTLAFPEGDGPALANLPAPDWPQFAADLDAPGLICLPVEPARYGGAAWAVPLPAWQRAQVGGEPGLAGVLLLGEKRDGGLYTQEEIEIAQASGERLLDLLASVEIARRLMDLQRQRLAESRDYGELSRAVFDQRARRLLHDEILPLLHAAMLTLSGAGEGKPAEYNTGAGDLLDLLAGAHRQISDLLREMLPTIERVGAARPEVERLGLVGALRALVDGELAGAFDGVTWQVDPEAEARAGTLPPLAAEVLFGAAREAVRNAARHGRAQPGGAMRPSAGWPQGRDERPLHLWLGLAWRDPAELGPAGPGRLELWVEDDGVGLQAGGQAVAGNGGQGLALHSTMMAVLGGTLAIERLPGGHTRVRLSLPARPASEACL